MVLKLFEVLVLMNHWTRHDMAMSTPGGFGPQRALAVEFEVNQKHFQFERDQVKQFKLDALTHE